MTSSLMTSLSRILQVYTEASLGGFGGVELRREFWVRLCGALLPSNRDLNAKTHTCSNMMVICLLKTSDTESDGESSLELDSEPDESHGIKIKIITLGSVKANEMIATVSGKAVQPIPSLIHSNCKHICCAIFISSFKGKPAAQL